MKQVDWKQWNVDAVGAGLVLTVILAGYGMLVHRPLGDALRKAPAVRDLEDARADLDSLQNTYTLQQRKVDAIQNRLDADRAALLRPRTADGFLSQLNDIAKQCGVQVARWKPMGVEDHDDYQAERFLVEGRASFPAIYRWLALIEAGVPFMDVTHFSIRTLAKGSENTCVFECSLTSYSDSPRAEQVAVAR